MTGVALAEELLLLAYDDETGRATMPRISLDLGMAAAVLVERMEALHLQYPKLEEAQLSELKKAEATLIAEAKVPKR